ncbi:MAG TPA: serine/threonine-protein kinase [Azospirillaceae bacterium]|nr:serine/threonine-protein kinase [Azospirillaceae bacterium]
MVSTSPASRRTGRQASRPTRSAPPPGSPPPGPPTGPPPEEGTIVAPRPADALEPTVAAPGTEVIGETLKDRFVLQALLGSGGMGKVYMALDLRKQEAADRKPYVAIKLLKENLREHPNSILAMQREARKAQELAHPNIIKVYDFDRDGNRFFITMELLTGRSLDRVIRAKDFVPMSPADAAPYVEGIGAALSFAHANGFVHSDLKPGNVFITETGRIKVIDFGLTRAIKSGVQGEDEQTVFDVGSLGAMTPAYASPEMLEFQPPHPRDDIYALACIAYELLTGRHPFGRIPATHARDIGMRPARVAALSPAQWQALERALSFDTARRPDDVAAFLAELGLSRPPPRARTLPPALTRRLLVPAAAAVALLVAGAALFRFVEFPTVREAEAVPAPVRTAAAAPLAQRLQGAWCGDALRLELDAGTLAYGLPDGTSVRLAVERADPEGDRLTVHAVAPDGERLVSEFGGLAADGGSMVQLRSRIEGRSDWRSNNRSFQRC